MSKATEDLQKAIALGQQAVEVLQKSHVKSYTKQDGTVVKEHDYKRQAHPHPWHAHHKAVAKLAREHDNSNQDRTIFEQAARDMKEQNHAGLRSTLRAADTYQSESILSHIHPDHWKKLGSTPLDKERAVGGFEKNHPTKPTRGDKPKAPAQADSNRDKWDNLHDEDNPRFAMQGMDSKALGKVAKGEISIKNAVHRELDNRGLDSDGKWVGFDKSGDHHSELREHETHKEADQPHRNNISEHLAGQNSSILSAAAKGHLDMKHLASEELASRGHDHEGKWIGFEAAAKLHGTKK